MFLVFVFSSIFWNAFWDAKRAMVDPVGVILGPPGRGKGRGKPPPLGKFAFAFGLLVFLRRSSAMLEPTLLILGPPGRGKGRGKPPPLRNKVQKL